MIDEVETQLHPERKKEIADLIDATAEKVMKDPGYSRETFLHLAERSFLANKTTHDPCLFCHSCGRKASESVNGVCQECYVTGRPPSQEANPPVMEEKKAAVPCAFCGKTPDTMVAGTVPGARICPDCVGHIHNALVNAGKLKPAGAPPPPPQKLQYKEVCDLINASSNVAAEINKVFELAKTEGKQVNLQPLEAASVIVKNLAEAAGIIHRVTTGAV